MSRNATVDRLRARAQHEALKDDEYTRRLLFEAVGEIERFARDAERWRAIYREVVADNRAKAEEVRRLLRRVPNSDDLRMALEYANRQHALSHEKWDQVNAAVARVRATLEETE